MSWIRSVYLAITLLIMLGGFGTAQTSSANSAETTNKLLNCFKAGNNTVTSMYACSGFWVTPRIFTLCFLEADKCLVIPDTPAAASVVSAELGGENPLDTKLSIDMAFLLTVPTRDIIDSCKSATTEDELQQCAALKMSGDTLAPILNCASQGTEKDKAVCLTKTAPSEVAKLTSCASQAPINADSIANCIPTTPEIRKAAEDARKCINDQSSAASGVGCLFPGAEQKTTKLAECIASSSNSAADTVECLRTVDPKTTDQIDQILCVSKAGDPAAITSCVSKNFGGDGAKIAGCATGPQDKVIACLFGNRPEYKAAAAAAACVQGGRDASSLIANCSNIIIKDPKTRAVLACAAQAGSDHQKLLGCVATAALPPTIAHFAACAATSTGPTSFGLCAAGPVMNEEWRIAAECATESGGVPLVFAGCAAGRLTFKELVGCLSGRKCFGPNNLIVLTFRKSFHDLLDGPGKNNDIVVALTKLDALSGGPNSVINNPGQLFGGKNSMVRNPGQITGGENSAVNVWLKKPLGGPNAAIPAIFAKPLGGSNAAIPAIAAKPLGGSNAAIPAIAAKPLGGTNSVIRRCGGLC
jgi:hypothetical protein